MSYFFFYSPLPVYPHVLKCQGICTDANVLWFTRDNPDTVIVRGYRGDKILAATGESVSAAQVMAEERQSRAAAEAAEAEAASRRYRRNHGGDGW